MSFLKKVIAHWTKSKDPNSSCFRHDMAEKISGYPVKYVTEKHGDNDDVIGRRGSINIKRETDELIVSTPAETIMRCDIDEMQAWILMSGDGVVITAPDKEHGGEVRTVTVHYVYYRK